MDIEDRRRAALVIANATRSRRARVKEAVRTHRMTLAEAFEDPAVQSMQVHRLLVEVPKVGHVKARKILGRNQITPSRLISLLSPHERAVLAMTAERNGSWDEKPDA